MPSDIPSPLCASLPPCLCVNFITETQRLKVPFPHAVRHFLLLSVPPCLSASVLILSQRLRDSKFLFLMPSGIPSPLCASLPLGSRFARRVRFPMGREPPQGAVTCLCVKTHTNLLNTGNLSNNNAPIIEIPHATTHSPPTTLAEYGAAICRVTTTDKPRVTNGCKR